ncbi:GNAT family N-acetyltransferase [Mycobacterium palustre]|nr:GNAT family N-acetyltransferase [Mycobacterium palustre]MCV7099003.1 GNAT family N-acetyltransferase [Mycobacterium palustre]
MSHQPVQSAASAELLDGRVVALRRLTGDDTAAALALHQHLTDHDRYFRFFTLNPVDLDKLVETMTEPSQGQYAIGAFDADRLIGIANYIVRSDDPEAAEIAVTVAHEDHSLGVGTALLKHLARIARARGIRRFVADVLGQNHLMFMVLSDLGWRRKPAEYGTVRHLEIDLPDFDDKTPTSAAEVITRETKCQKLQLNSEY